MTSFEFDTQAVDAVVKYNGKIKSVPVWSSSDAAIVVEAAADGMTAVITASAEASATVTVVVDGISVSADVQAVVADATSGELTLTVRAK